LIICIAIISIVLTWIFYNYYKYDYNVVQINVYDMKIKVEPGVVGFNLENDNLNFGTVIPSGVATRYIVLSSEKPVRVFIFFEGDMKQWVSVENNFILEGNKTLEFVANIPANTKPGDYTGKAIIIFKKI